MNSHDANTPNIPEFRGNVEATPGGTVFTGLDGTQLFAATALKTAIKMYLNTGLKMNRHLTPSGMLDTASRYTGQKYKRGKVGLRHALGDLESHIRRQQDLLRLKNAEVQGNA